MQMAAAAELLPGLDQALVDRVELVGVLRDDAPLDRLFEPGPLKHRGLEDRGRRVGVVFEQLCRSLSVERRGRAGRRGCLRRAPSCPRSAARSFAGFSAASDIPRRRSRWPTSARHIASISPVGASMLPLDLIQREGVVAALVPVALAVDGVEIEAAGLRGLRASRRARGRRCAASMELSAAMPHGRAAMAMTVEMMQRAAEAAVPGRAAAIGPAVAAGHRGLAGTAVHGAAQIPSRRRRPPPFPSSSARRGVSVS